MYMIEEFHVIGEELNKGVNMDSKKIKQVIDQIHYFLDNVSLLNSAKAVIIYLIEL